MRTRLIFKSYIFFYLSHIFFIYQLKTVKICKPFLEGSNVLFISHPHYSTLTNLNKYSIICNNSNSQDTSQNINDNIKLDGFVLEKNGIGIVGNVELKNEPMVKQFLNKIYSDNDYQNIKNQLFTKLNEFLSICSLNDVIDDINDLIANKNYINLTHYYSKCIIHLANNFNTNKIIQLFRFMLSVPELLDLFHFSLIIRYLAHVNYSDIDQIYEFFRIYNNISLHKSKYGLFSKTDDIVLFTKNTKSCINNDYEFNALSIFGLNHSFIFDREHMNQGILESFVIIIAQNINKHLHDNDNLPYKHALTNMVKQFNNYTELSWISKVILRHLNRSICIEDEPNIMNNNIIGYNDRLFTNLYNRVDFDKQSETIEESLTNTIDTIINSPLSTISSDKKTDLSLALPRFIYPSTHTQILNELDNCYNYSRIIEIANLQFKNVNESDLAITDIYYTIRRILKFKKATSVIESLLKFKVLNSDRLLEHIKICAYECEIERDPVEALKVLIILKEKGIMPLQGLIDNLALELNNSEDVEL